MGKAITYSKEVPCKVSAARFFACGPQDAHSHFAQSIPHIVTEAVNLVGDGSVGTIRFFRLQDGLPFSHLKMHIDVTDKEKYEFKWTLLDGGNVGKKLASAVYHLKITPADDKGCICKLTGELTTLPGVEFTRKDIEEEKEFYATFILAVDKYLVENPDAYAYADA